jgi:hypothetical protein
MGKERKMVAAGQVISAQVPSHVEITVRRPNGITETVRMPAQVRELTPGRFAELQKGTKAAGRGDVLSYANITKAATYTVSAADAVTDSGERIERAMRAGE